MGVEVCGGDAGAAMVTEAEVDPETVVGVEADMNLASVS